jgi:hypothetical protein
MIRNYPYAIQRINFSLRFITSRSPTLTSKSGAPLERGNAARIISFALSLTDLSTK